MQWGVKWWFQAVGDMQQQQHSFTGFGLMMIPARNEMSDQTMYFLNNRQTHFKLHFTPRFVAFLMILLVNFSFFPYTKDITLRQKWSLDQTFSSLAIPGPINLNSSDLWASVARCWVQETPAAAAAVSDQSYELMATATNGQALNT